MHAALRVMSQSYQGLIASMKVDGNEAVSEYQFALHMAALTCAEDDIRRIADELTLIRATHGVGSLLYESRLRSAREESIEQTVAATGEVDEDEELEEVSPGSPALVPASSLLQPSTRHLKRVPGQNPGRREDCGAD